MSSSRFELGLLITLGSALGGGGLAHAASTDWIGDSRAAVRLITGTGSVATDTVIDAGLEFRFADGWHGYWRTPGDAGVAPQVDWSGSENLARAEIAWPAPHRLVIEGLQNSVYENRVVLPVKLHLQKAAEVRISASVGYAACSDICVPYTARLRLTLPSGSAAPEAEAVLIDQARKILPTTPSAAGIEVVDTRFVGAGTEHKLIVDVRSNTKPFARPDLLIEGAGNGLPAAPAVDLRDAGKSARLTAQLPASLPAGRPLTLTLTDGDRAAEFAVPGGPAAAAGRAGLWAALVSALIGGLILNLMPCVLPVVSLKLFAFIRHAGTDLREIRIGSAATASGIIVSFVVLAVCLIALKGSGVALGWGIQFQQPWFLAAMASVTVLFAASFFDWLHIGLPNSIMTIASVPARGSKFESFLTGALATLLATPCSAPFVGTAVGFALALGPFEILATFLCLGLGMALPYLLAALIPGCVRWLPRPGPWMVGLRKLLGVLMLGTAVWLIFVLWSNAGRWIAGATALLLTGLLGYRALTRADLASPARRTVATLLLAIAPFAISLSAATSTARPIPETEWQSFDPDAVARLIAEGKTVLVDVTATWCLTCKVNELTVLRQAEVRSRLKRPDVVLMRADWTRPDQSVADYLNGFGRYGIPLDVVYGPRRPEGDALPELLTSGILLSALDQAAGAAPNESVAGSR